MQAIIASSAAKTRRFPVPALFVSGLGIRMPETAQCCTLLGLAPAMRAMSVTEYSCFLSNMRAPSY